jgi:hypothetical protein
VWTQPPVLGKPPFLQSPPALHFNGLGGAVDWPRVLRPHTSGLVESCGNHIPRVHCSNREDTRKKGSGEVLRNPWGHTPVDCQALAHVVGGQLDCTACHHSWKSPVEAPEQAHHTLTCVHLSETIQKACILMGLTDLKKGATQNNWLRV